MEEISFPKTIPKEEIFVESSNSKSASPLSTDGTSGLCRSYEQNQTKLDYSQSCIYLHPASWRALTELPQEMLCSIKLNNIKTLSAIEPQIAAIPRAVLQPAF